MSHSNGKGKSLKALVLEAYNQFSYQDVPEPEIKANEVLIRVQACGICGSDVHGMDGSTGRRIPPIIMGHEASGTIERLGSEVKKWNLGDRVTFDSTVYCKGCFFCRRGDINLCDDRKVLGVSCGEYRQHGAYAEFVAVPEHILYRIPDGVSFEHAAMVEPVSVAVHAVSRLPIELNASALVVGVGMIGLLVVQALRAAGCGKIIAVDIDDDKLALAKELGADEVIRSDQPGAAQKIRALTEENRGVDVAVEVVGIAPTVSLAIDALRKGGSLAVVGNITPKIEVSLQSIVTREISVVGSCASSGEYPACLDLIERGSIQLDPIISAVVPLDESPSWFTRLYEREPKLMKVVVRPSIQ